MSNNPYLEKMNKAKGKSTTPNNTITPKNTSNKFMSAMDKVRTNPIKGPVVTTYTPEKEEVTPKKSDFLPNIGKSLNSGVANFNKGLINVADTYFKAVDNIPGIDTTSQQNWLQKRREDNDRVMVKPNEVDTTNASLPEKAAYMLARSAVDLIPANIIGKASGAVKVGKLTESAIANKLGGKLGQYAGNAVKEGIENTAYGVTVDTFNKESKEDMLKNAGTNFVGGAGVGTILKGAGNLLPKLNKTNKANTPVNNVVDSPKIETTPIEPTINNNPANSPVELPKVKTDTVALPEVKAPLNVNKVELPKVNEIPLVRVKKTATNKEIPITEQVPIVKIKKERTENSPIDVNEWGKDSKVKDANGLPKQVYHGTSSYGFSQFDKNKIPDKENLMGSGFYFTEDKKIANTYRKKGDGDNKGTYNAYLDIKNPFDADNPKIGIGLAHDFMKYLDDNNISYDKRILNDIRDMAQPGIKKQSLVGKIASLNNNAFRDYLQSKGYDGITHTGGIARKTQHKVWIAFEPNQINISNKDIAKKPQINNTEVFKGYKEQSTSKKVNDRINETVFSGTVKNGIELPKVNNAKIETPKDPLSLIEGISVGNVPKVKGERTKVNYSKMDEPDINSAEIKVEKANKTKDGIAEDFDVTAKPVQSIVTGTNKAKTSFKDKWENAYSRIVDVKKPIDKVSNESYVKATNSANSGSVVESNLTNYLSDIKGNKIGDSLQKTLEDNVPKGEEVDFWEYALQRHNVARVGQEKPIYYKDKDIAYTPEESKARAEYLEKQHPEWKEKADNISKWIDDFMKEWGVKAGTIDEAAYNEMRAMYPNYIPSNRGFNDLEDFLPGGSGNGRGFVDQSTPIKGATGSQRDIVDPTESIMNLVNRTIRTAKYNEVGQSVVKAVKENPAMSGLAEILPPPKPFMHNPYENMDNVVTVLDGGKPVYLQINDKQLLGALKSINKLDLHDGAKAIKTINTAFKALITTKNPVFAIRNVMRDIPTYLINSKENNPFKLLGNLGGAVKDIATNSPTYQQYKALGGGGSNFLKGDATKSATELTGKVPILDPMGKVIGYRNISTGKKMLNAIGGGIEKLNNVTESAPRLAEFKNSLGRGENLDKAMFDAAEVTTNFSRGGDITKFFDVFTPYLNASVQGLDKLGRQAVKNPVQTALKGATVVTLPVLAMNQVNKDNPNFKDLDNRTKDNYILLPNVWGEKDDEGNAKTFIKIPKSREYGVLFGSLAERFLRQQAGEENSFKGFGSTLSTNFAPANPIEDNIAMPAANILMGGNKDFAGRDIVPRAMSEDGRSKYLQYDEKTSEVTKKIAELASKQGIELSPKQMDYLIRSYLGVIAQLGLPLTTKNTMQGGNAREKALKPLTTQFIADPAYSNQGITDFYDKLDKSKQLAADRNILEKVDSKTVTTQEQTRNALNKVSTEMSAISKQIKEAEAKGDKKLVTNLRLRMLQLSKEANAKYKVK